MEGREAPKTIKENRFNPKAYLQEVRSRYHAGAEFRGQRSDEQKTIAALLADEADQLFDGVKTLMAVLTGKGGEAIMEKNEKEFKYGSLTFDECRDAFRQMYVGLGVITNRIADKSSSFRHNQKQLMDLPNEDRLQVMGQLFSDFQNFNAYRLGTKGFGIMRTVTHYTEDGGVERTRVDRDAGQTEDERQYIASLRGYREQVFAGEALHAAVKIDPEEMVRLRLEFPEVPADDFFRIVWGVRNPEQALANLSQ